MLYGKRSENCLAPDLQSHCKVKGQNPAQESLDQVPPHSASLSAYLQYFLSGLHCAASESVIFLRFPITVRGSALGRSPLEPFTVRRQNSTILIKVESALQTLYSRAGFAVCLECMRNTKQFFFIIRPCTAPMAAFP